jgi:hypothetical protein
MRRQRWEDHLSIGIKDQPWLHNKTPSSNNLKIKGYTQEIPFKDYTLAREKYKNRTPGEKIKA